MSGMPVRVLIVGYASYRRAFSQAGPVCTGVRSTGLSRVELTAGRLPGRVGGTAGSDAYRSTAAAPPTRPASSGSAGEAGAFEGTARGGGRRSSTDSPLARRSAALPASPCPSEPRPARKSGGSLDARLAAGCRGARSPRRRRGPVARWVAADGWPVGVVRAAPGRSWVGHRARPTATAGRRSRGGGRRHRRDLGILVAGVPAGRSSDRCRRAGPTPPTSPARLHAGPRPGTSGRPGTRSRGSTPPGARARAAPGGPRRSSGGRGRARSSARRDHLRTRRTDTPGSLPWWAGHGRSSGR